jgi:hypothetical protein
VDQVNVYVVRLFGAGYVEVEAISVDDAQVKAEALYPEFQVATVPLRCD